MNTTDGLHVDVSSYVATITIDRPHARNALTWEILSALSYLYDRFDRDSAVRVVLLTSTPGPAFCAGIDVKQFGKTSSAETFAAMPMGGVYRNVFEVMIECGKPTIAAVDGAAMGAGCELALASDIRVLSPRSVLSFPEAKVGMGANFGAQMLPRLIPRGIAYEHLYTGRPIDALRAQQLGLANHVVEDVRSRASELCREIAANAPLTVRRFKQVISAGADLPLSTALRQRPIPDPYGSADRVEGIAALVERRPPRWEDR